MTAKVGSPTASVSLLLRRAVPADAAAVCGLVRTSIVELCGADHQGDESTIAAWLANKTQDNFASWISSPRHVAIVAERAGSAVGFALLSTTGTILLLYVAPEYRFTGVSKAMLASLEEHAASLGIAELKLESSATALSFYERFGYSGTGETVQGFGITRAYPLSKRLAP
jgi:GNAT superfamily N-acetyltransferase